MCPQSVEFETTRIERLADLLMLLSHEPMFAWKLNGAIEFWSAGAEQLYGFASNEAIGRSSHSLLQTKFPIDFTGVRSRLRNERYWSGELRHTCKDGHEVVVDSRMQLLGDDTVLEVNRDVTKVQALIARQAALVRDLSNAAAKFEAIFNQSGIFAGVLDLHGYVREVNPKGETVWEINKDDLPGFPLHVVQEVDRLANGNTVICNWSGFLKKPDWPNVIQIIEVTPQKKVVWALREWTNPDLGPASCIQLLDEPGKAENRDLQR